LETYALIAEGVVGLKAGFNSGKMKCVNSATPGPMKMNHAMKPAMGTL
jgi:hypothetical protein